MAIIFSEGFEDYGHIAPGQKLEIGISSHPAKVEIRAGSESSFISYDVTPPKDGRWYSISQIFMVDEHGNLYAKEAPTISPVL